MKLTQVARASLGEVQEWVVEERGSTLGEHGHTDGQGRTRTNTDGEAGRRCGNDQVSVKVSDSPFQSVSSLSLSSVCLAANAALSLLNLACCLLDRQVGRLAVDFENEGGFTERLYRGAVC
ncbi:MAG: four helix bundle suffix domain-containing protein [Acidobacteriota bacterium]